MEADSGQVNQQVDKRMEGWMDRWKAQGENEVNLKFKKQFLPSYTYNFLKIYE